MQEHPQTPRAPDPDFPTDAPVESPVEAPDDAAAPAPVLRLAPPPSVPFYRPTQAGLAERTLHRFGPHLLYVPERRTWFVWTGDRWSENPQLLRLRIIEAARSLGSEADRLPSTLAAQRIPLLKLAMQAEEASFIEGVATLAAVMSSKFGCQRSAALFDPSPWLLNCANGSVDLQTGALSAHSPRDFLTRNTEIPYDPSLPTSPLWSQFLDRVLPDPETQAFVQRAVGASLTGRPIEERFLFLHGPAATGKSTFLSALRGALGGYFQTASFETFLKGSGSGPRQDLAVLQGARIVIASEADDDRAFASGLLKSVTGGEQITARYLYGREFSFVPSFTLWLASNSRPTISAEDSGLWRRIVEVPFVQCIPESDRDPGVKTALVTSRVCQETVLKWAIDGCLAWQRDGLRPPQVVRDAVTEYHASCDALGSFLSECYIKASAEQMLLMKDVHDRYSKWCETEGIKPISNRRFRKAIGDRGWASKEVAQGVAVVGIRLAK